MDCSFCFLCLPSSQRVRLYFRWRRWIAEFLIGSFLSHMLLSWYVNDSCFFFNIASILFNSNVSVDNRRRGWRKCQSGNFSCAAVWISLSFQWKRCCQSSSLAYTFKEGKNMLRRRLCLSAWVLECGPSAHIFYSALLRIVNSSRLRTQTSRRWCRFQTASLPGYFIGSCGSIISLNWLLFYRRYQIQRLRITTVQ